MICFPNAKINLGLRVLRKRPDSFHDIETCMLPIPLYDVLEFKESEKFNIDVIGADLGSNFEDNIIYKTWVKLSELYDIPAFDIKLLKNIPINAGLGGGSADAAFFLKEINSNYHLELTRNGMEMFLENIGSDCPFFVRNKTAMAYSKGEILEKEDVNLSGLMLTIVKPDISISTAKAYDQIVPQLRSESLSELIKMPINRWKANIFNDFEDYVSTQMPELEPIKKRLYDLGAEYVSLSGSGSAIYALSKINLKLSKTNYNFIWQGML